MSAEQKEIDLESELNFKSMTSLFTAGPEGLSQIRGVKYSPQNCSYCGGKGRNELYVRVVVLDKLRGGGGGEDQCMHVALHEIRDVLRDVVGHKHDRN